MCHSEPGAWKPADYDTSDCPLFPGKSAYHIGRTMFETDRIPKGWAKKMNRMDEVWVPSVFMKEVFERGGVRNIRVVGESVNTAFFRPIPSLHSAMSVREDEANAFNITRAYLYEKVFERHPLYGTHTDVFLALFKWEFRKGWDILLDAFFSAFSKQDKVSLFIITQEYHEDRPSFSLR